MSNVSRHMPIVDIEFVAKLESELSTISANALASALGKIFGSMPGRTWVRLRFLSSNAYAENESNLSSGELPAFVTVLHAYLPDGEALAAEMQDLPVTLAGCLGRAPERVHVQYTPEAAGRQAFGGKLVP